QPHFKRPICNAADFTLSLEWTTFGESFHYFVYVLKKTSELIYKFLVTKLIVGMPFKDLATDTSLLLRKLPSADDVTSQIVKRFLDSVEVDASADIASLKKRIFTQVEVMTDHTSTSIKALPIVQDPPTHHKQDEKKSKRSNDQSSSTGGGNIKRGRDKNHVEEEVKNDG
ncbi:hypothetical protein RYX36_006416, partial [Vicia faba]